MRITELLDIRSIALDAAPKSKQETLDAAVALMVKSGKITDEDAYRAQVYAREEESTTGIGEGIAIPHGKCDAVNKPGLAAMVIPNGVDFDSLDGEPVTLLFLIAAPNTKDNVHLDVLSKLSMMLMDEEFTKSLRNARTPEEFLAIIDRADEEKKSVDERLAEPVEAKENQVKILAVTSCPTGIAHTYMAAEGIEKAAKAKGCFVKVDHRIPERKCRHEPLVIVAAVAFIHDATVVRLDDAEVLEGRAARHNMRLKPLRKLHGNPQRNQLKFALFQLYTLCRTQVNPVGFPVNVAQPFNFIAQIFNLDFFHISFLSHSAWYR